MIDEETYYKITAFIGDFVLALVVVGLVAMGLRNCHDTWKGREPVERPAPLGAL